MCSPTTTSFTSTARWIRNPTSRSSRPSSSSPICRRSKRLCPGWRKSAQQQGDRKPVHEAALAAQQILDEGKTLFGSKRDWSEIRELNLLTTKPFLYAFNCDESILTDADRVQALRNVVAPADAVFLDAKIERARGTR